MTKALTIRKKAPAVTVSRKRYPNRPLNEIQIRTLLGAIDNVRDDALIRLGLSSGLRVSEVVSIRTSEIDFDRGLIKIWDEKKDKWRFIMPTLETMSAVRKYLNSLDHQTQSLFQCRQKPSSGSSRAIPKNHWGLSFPGIRSGPHTFREVWSWSNRRRW